MNRTLITQIERIGADKTKKVRVNPLYLRYQRSIDAFAPRLLFQLNLPPPDWAR